MYKLYYWLHLIYKHNLHTPFYVIKDDENPHETHGFHQEAVFAAVNSSPCFCKQHQIL